MKWFLLLALLGIALPIHGQKESPKSASPNAGVVLSQQMTNTQNDRTATASKSYLSRLFSPENLPNIGLLIAGVLGIIVAIRTLRYIGRQVDLLERQITIPYRAYLSVVEPECLNEAERFRLNFRIRNYGHMAAEIKHISMEVIVQVTQTGEELFRRDSIKQVKHTIPPERDDMFAVEIELPASCRDSTSVVSGKISYDTGFNQDDLFEFVRVFIGWYSTWTTASVSESFNFTDAEDKKSEKHPN
jgi:hypothetical protein